MCYRCRLCDDVVPHNVPMKKLVLYKEGGKAIRAELGVCAECDPNKPSVVVVKPVLSPSPNGKRPHKAERQGPLCDVCSQPIGENGQQTAESTLCEKHLPKRPKGKSKR
jgi:hypothetical protein